MLPIDTLSWNIHIDGIGTIPLYSFTSESPGTILGVSFTQEKDLSTTELWCGSDIVFVNWAKDVPYCEMVYICDDDLYLEKTGQDEAFVVINYVARDYHEQVLYPATTTPALDNNIDYGDILIGFFLLLLLMGSVFGFLVNKFILKNDI
jgi:hypothetical protein